MGIFLFSSFRLVYLYATIKSFHRVEKSFYHGGTIFLPWWNDIFSMVE